MKIAKFDNPVISTWLAENGLRLDSSPYLSEAVQAKATLKKFLGKSKSLKEVTKGIYHAGREGRTYVNNPDFGVPFLGSTDILAADLSSLPLLSKKQVAANPLFTLEEEWTLITRSGTVGRMAFVRPDMAGIACSEHVMRVVPNPDEILPGYLYAYLSSKFGVPQVTAGTYGAIIQHIEPQHIKDLPVPLAPLALQQKIHNLIDRMAKLRFESAQGYQQATQKIFHHIHLSDPQRHQWLSDNRREAFAVMDISTKTLRAINYDPRYVQLNSELMRIPHSKLGELCDPKHFKSGIIFKRIDADQEYAVRLVGQREAFQVRPEGRWISRKSIEGLGLVVPFGTTLIAAHGTLGETELYCRSTFVTERTSEYAFSGDFVRCIPLEDKIPSGYLFAWLRSETAFRMLRCISIGSKQQAPHPDLLWKLPIPRLTEELEQEIHTQVLENTQKFDNSLYLEEDSWRLLENWIEGETQ